MNGDGQGAFGAAESGDSQDTRALPPLSGLLAAADASGEKSSRHYFTQSRPQSRHQEEPLASNSQRATFDSQSTTILDSQVSAGCRDQLFTPPISEGGDNGGSSSSSSNGNGNSQSHSQNQSHTQESEFSAQGSQLLQLSELAAASARMEDRNTSVADAAASSRKRTADGTVKLSYDTSATSSPVFSQGHSRNTSTASTASTANGNISQRRSVCLELSSKLKDSLSYAMLKATNGWEGGIDEIEKNYAPRLASPASSTTSTTSTVHGYRASASPRMPGLSLHQRHLSQPSVSFSNASRHHLPPPIDTPSSSSWSPQLTGCTSNTSTPPLLSPLQTGTAAPALASTASRTLAPPVSIRPSLPASMARSNSNPGYASASFPSYSRDHNHGHNHGHNHSHSHSHSTSSQASPDVSPIRRTPVVDPILFSPHQDVREQDAIETLLFMSSPGNSANMKRFPTMASSQPLPSGYHDPRPPQSPLSTSDTATASGPASTTPQRHALPGAPRKSLPTSRPNGLQQLRPDRTPDSGRHAHASQQRGRLAHHHQQFQMPGEARGSAVSGAARLLGMPAGLALMSRPRPVLGDSDIERMLDRAAAEANDSDDSDGEIPIPARRQDVRI